MFVRGEPNTKQDSASKSGPLKLTMGLSRNAIRQEIRQLVALRIRNGISLSVIEEETKIRIEYLTAIEEGRFEHLPDGVYRINYLKQYAARIDAAITERLSAALSDWSDPGCLDEEGWSYRRPYWWANSFFSGIAMAMAITAPVNLAAQVAPPPPAPNPCPSDNRCDLLVKFFKKFGSPLSKYAGDFLMAADRHHLDWRLLPSISMVESSGGKYYSYGNVFGWNSGRARFRSISAGIHYVAAQFGTSSIYVGKDTLGILRQYNPARGVYPKRVMRFIEQIPVEVAATIAK
jgi:hypothetical protein